MRESSHHATSILAKQSQLATQLYPHSGMISLPPQYSSHSHSAIKLQQISPIYLNRSMNASLPLRSGGGVGGAPSWTTANTTSSQSPRITTTIDLTKSTTKPSSTINCQIQGSTNNDLVSESMSSRENAAESAANQASGSPLSFASMPRFWNSPFLYNNPHQMHAMGSPPFLANNLYNPYGINGGGPGLSSNGHFWPSGMLSSPQQSQLSSDLTSDDSSVEDCKEEVLILRTNTNLKKRNPYSIEELLKKPDRKRLCLDQPSTAAVAIVNPLQKPRPINNDPPSDTRKTQQEKVILPTGQENQNNSINTIERKRASFGHEKRDVNKLLTMGNGTEGEEDEVEDENNNNNKSKKRCGQTMKAPPGNGTEDQTEVVDEHEADNCHIEICN